MAKKLSTLLKDARTGAGLTQTALAEEVDGMTASDIGKAERGEKVPTQAQLKQIAKATGVTQTSLLEASKSASAKKTSTSTSKKTASASSKTSGTSGSSKKTGTASSKKTGTGASKKSGTSASKKTGTEASKKTGTSSSKKTGTSSSKKTGSSAKTGTSLTAGEQTLLEAYRAADSDTRKLAVKILKGEKLEIGELLPTVLGGVLSNFIG